jgi:sensor histidine kinase regulating citrate/malate metabolism
MALWAVWTVTAAVRLLISDIKVNVNIEYQFMYGFVLLLLTFYGIAQYARRMKDMQKHAFIMNTKVEGLMQNFELLKTHFAEIGLMKHEIKNHLAAMQAYLESGKYREAKDYLDKYAEQAVTITETVWHENHLINVLVHDLLRRAEAIGTKVTLNLRASPENISEPDLYSLLTNIKENALEACAKMPENRKRTINLSVTRREPYLVIICENSNPGVIKEDGEIRTSKPENGHGFGLKIIERIVNANDGIMDIAHDGGTFILTAALKYKKNNKEELKA